MVNAWCIENGIGSGRIKTSGKSNEITAIPELVKMPELNDCTVTTDAMGTQTKIAEAIIDKGADCVLALKGSHGNPNSQVTLFFENVIKNDFKDISFDSHTAIDSEQGRLKTRKYTAVSEIDWLHGKENRSGLKTIVMVESKRDINNEASKEIRYYISSMEDSADLPAAGRRKMITVSIDEKPGVQAVDTAAPDLPPKPGCHKNAGRDYEYKPWYSFYPCSP